MIHASAPGSRPRGLSVTVSARPTLPPALVLNAISAINDSRTPAPRRHTASHDTEDVSDGHFICGQNPGIPLLRLGQRRTLASSSSCCLGLLPLVLAELGSQGATRHVRACDGARDSCELFFCKIFIISVQNFAYYGVTLTMLNVPYLTLR